MGLMGPNGNWMNFGSDVNRVDFIHKYKPVDILHLQHLAEEPFESL